MNRPRHSRTNHRAASPSPLPNPDPWPRRGVLRTQSSQSASLHSRDLNSLIFHNDLGDDNATRFSDYAFSESSVNEDDSGRGTAALNGLCNTIAAQLDDSWTIYTSGGFMDEDALVRAIAEGEKRAAQEARDEVMGLKDHENWTLHKVDPVVVLPRSCLCTTSDSKKHNSSVTSLNERKQHRKQTRKETADKKHCKKGSETSGTEESTSSSSTLENRLDQSASSHPTRRATRQDRRSVLMQSARCSSQPSLTSHTQSTTFEDHAVQPRARTKTRPPVTKKTRALAEVDERRSRSLTRALAKTVRRSLSRLRKGLKKEEKKKVCTCPSSEVMLTSCPKHKEKARQILKKKKHADEKHAKRKQKRSNSRTRVRSNSRTRVRSHKKEHHGDKKEDSHKKEHGDKKKTTARRSSMDHHSSSKKRQGGERGRTRGHSSMTAFSRQGTEETVPNSAAFSRQGTVETVHSVPASNLLGNRSTTGPKTGGMSSSARHHHLGTTVAEETRPRRSRSVVVSVDC